MPWRSWWRAAVRRREFENGMADELRFHLDARTDHWIQAGYDPDEARRRARLEFGSVDSRREECRQARGLRLHDELRADLRYAFRMMRHRPAFALTAILFLGIAIGVNTTAFTFLNALLFRQLPVKGAERHVDITAFGQRHNIAGRWSRPAFELLAGRSEPFDGVYAIERITGALAGERASKLEVEVVSPNFLPLLGARTLMGRDFADSPEPALTLSYAGWMHRFGGDPSVVGRRLRIGKNFFLVTGVMERRFTGVEAMTPDAWAPDRWRSLLLPPGKPAELQVGGILRPGITAARAAAALSAALPGLNQGLAESDRLSEVNVDLRPGLSHVEDGNLILTGMAGCAFLLLILVACANLASLHLAGAYARQRELAIRLSLGATRARVVRQLLVEAALLSGLGALLALALTWLSVSAVQSFAYQIFTRLEMNMAPAEPDWRVALFAGLMSLAAAIAFGLLPALEATRSASPAAARQQTGAILHRSGPSRMRFALIAGQTAANLVLLVVAGILLQNAARLDRASPGFAVDGLYDTGYEGRLKDYRKLLAADSRIAAITGVFRIPQWGMMYPVAAEVDGRPMSLAHNYVDDRFFETFGIPLVRGRAFTPAEAGSRAAVAVVSEATARKLWPDRNALGRTILVGAADSNGPAPRAVQVVGVAKDVISGMLLLGTDSTLVYLPAAVGSAEVQHLVVRARDPGGRFVAALQQKCLDLDGSFCGPMALTEVAWLQRFPVRMASQVAMALGLMALLLSCVGLYGVVALTVVRRTREAGIRLALGASRWMVMRPMMASSLRGAAAGIAVGLPLCFAVARWADSMAEFLHLADPAVFLAVPALLAGVVFAATLIPARKASSTGPAAALRHE